MKKTLRTSLRFGHTSGTSGLIKPKIKKGKTRLLIPSRESVLRIIESQATGETTGILEMSRDQVDVDQRSLVIVQPLKTCRIVSKNCPQITPDIWEKSKSSWDRNAGARTSIALEAIFHNNNLRRSWSGRHHRVDQSYAARKVREGHLHAWAVNTTPLTE